MRIEAHSLTYNIGALGTSAVEQSHFIHSIKELAVRGLETVNFRNCTRDDNAHNIGHIVFFNRFGNGLLNYRSVNDFFFLIFLLSCHSEVSFLSGLERYGEASAPYTSFTVCAAARIKRL